MAGHCLPHMSQSMARLCLPARAFDAAAPSPVPPPTSPAQVNAHLNSEVERLTLANDALAAEKAALEKHVRHLAHMLADARARLPEVAAAAAQAAEAAAQAEAEEEAAAAELQSDAFAAADLSAAGGAEQPPQGQDRQQQEQQQQEPPPPWLAPPAWARMQAAGRRQGWLVDPQEVILGDVIGRGTFGEPASLGWVVAQSSWQLCMCMALALLES